MESCGALAVALLLQFSNDFLAMALPVVPRGSLQLSPSCRAVMGSPLQKVVWKSVGRPGPLRPPWSDLSVCDYLGGVIRHCFLTHGELGGQSRLLRAQGWNQQRKLLTGGRSRSQAEQSQGHRDRPVTPWLCDPVTGEG